jgi:chromosome partitioning protein
MRVWAALSQKGGSGKSTIMLHLAIAATAANRIASVIDLDPQKSAEKWGILRERKTKTDDPIIVHGLPSQLDSMLDKARETGHELVLIDTPPTIDRTTILVAAKADLIIVPTRTSVLDLQALDDTLTILKATQGVNRIVVVINAAGPDAKAREAIKKLVRKQHGIPLLGAALEEHLEFRTSLGSGRGVTEAAAQSPAGKELKKLYGALSRWDEQLAKSRKGVAA